MQIENLAQLTIEKNNLLAKHESLALELECNNYNILLIKSLQYECYLIRTHLHTLEVMQNQFLESSEFLN